MRRWLLGSVSGLLTAVTLAAAAFAAANFHGPSTEDLLRDIAVIDRELALAERTLETYKDSPPIAEQVALRMAVLETTRAMLEQKRLSWLRGLNLVFRIDGWEVVPDRHKLEDLQAQLTDAEAGMLTARIWAARANNDVSRRLAMTLEQVHLLTHAAIRQQMAVAGLGLALPPVEAPDPVSPSPEVVSEDRTGVVGALERPSVRP